MHAQDASSARIARAVQLRQTGEAYVRAGNPGPAVAYFRDALSVDASDTASYIGLARIYLDRGSLSDAGETVLIALRRLPDRVDLWLLLAEVYERQGRTAESTQALREAASRSHDDENVLTAAANNARARGAWSEALASYRRLTIVSTSAGAEAAARYVQALTLLAVVDPVARAARDCTHEASPIRRALAACEEGPPTPRPAATGSAPTDASLSSPSQRPSPQPR